MRHRIKIRLMELGKTQQGDLLNALRERGIVINESRDLGKMLNGVTRTPRAEKIVAMCDEIVTAWEAAAERERK